MSSTTNYNLNKPTYGTRNWDIPLNQNFDVIDSTLADVVSQLADSVNLKEDSILVIPQDYLQVPSTLADGLATHPSLIDFGASKWNGYRYWMAFTPYPGTDNENPCIACSNDNVNWVMPNGLTNPLVPTPEQGYNSDTEMIYIPETNSLRIYYRQYGFDDNVQIFCIESTDGTTWSEPTLVIDDVSLKLSPSIIRVSSDLYKMWYVVDAQYFGYRTSSDGITWSSETLQSQPWQNVSVWHIGVYLDSNGVYHLLGSAYPTTKNDGVQYRPIYYAYSLDGNSWVANETPQLIPSGWASGYLYRPSFIIDETKGVNSNGLPYVRLWFSAATASGQWHIGYTEGYLQDHTDETLSSKTVQRKNLFEAFRGFFGILKAGAARIASLIADTITIKNSFSAPSITIEDGRVGVPAGSKTRIQWSGSDVDANNRLRFGFAKQGTTTTILFQIAPFANWMGFVSPGSFFNLKKIRAGGQEFTIEANDRTNTQRTVLEWNATENAFNFKNFGIQGLGDLRSQRVIVYNDGIRVYKQDSNTEWMTLRTNSAGSLSVSSSTQQNRYFRFRQDGHMQAVGAGIMDLSYLNLAPQDSRPSPLTSARTGVYLADGVNHDPCSVGEGKPYLVYWDGTNYTKLS